MDLRKHDVLYERSDASEDIGHDLRFIANELRRVGDELDNHPAYSRMVRNIAEESVFGRQYSTFTSLVREFVMLVTHKANISGDLVKKVIRIFLSMWNNQELSKQLLEELTQGQSDIPPDESEENEQIPHEIQLMNDEFLRQYHTVLSKGMEHVNSVRLMVVGMYGVGKTSLVENLIERTESENAMKIKPESTVGIDVRHCSITDDGRWVEDLFDHDTSERIHEVINNARSDIPSTNVDVVDAGIEENPVTEEIIYERTAFEKNMEVNYEHCSDEEISRDDENSLSALREKIMSTDDQHYNHFIRYVMSGLNSPLNVPRHSPTVSVWDFAGQYIYYSTHHFFLNARSIYLLLMNISMPLDSLVKEKSEFPLSGFLHKDFTCLEAFKFWLNSIHMYSSQEVHEEDIHPIVILVGTHKDEMTGSDSEKEKKKEEYFNKALASFIGTPILARVHKKKFLINNLNSEEGFEIIREEVLELAKKQKYWGEKRPAKWIPLERAFHGFKSEGKEIITFEDVREAGRQNDIRIESEDELRLFLRFQNSLGNILYYETDLLKDHVILSPQWIIDAFRCFISHVPNKNPIQLEQWDDFEKKAILTQGLIDEILDKNDYFKDYKTQIIEYMEYLDMIAKPVRSDDCGDGKTSFLENLPLQVKGQDDDNDLETDFIESPVHNQQRIYEQRNEPKDTICGTAAEHLYSWNNSSSLIPSDFHIVPALLQSRPRKDELSRLVSPPDIDKTPALCIKFSNGFMPPSVFHRLLAICLRNFQIVPKLGQFLLYNGLAVFKIDKTITLTIWFQDNIIYARVCFYSEKDHYVAQSARQFLVKNLGDILSILPAESRINEMLPFEEYIQCTKVSSFQPGVGLLRMRDFLYGNVVLCEHPELHSVTKKEAIGDWCYGSIQRQETAAIRKDVLKRRPTEKELARIAMGIGDEYFRLGLELNVTNARLHQIREEYPFHVSTRIYHVLYACKNANESLSVEHLRNAMIAVDSDIETFDSVFSESFGEQKELKRDQGIDYSRKPLLTELSILAGNIGYEYWLLLVELGIPEKRLQQLRMDNLSVQTSVYKMLLEWLKGDVNIQELGKAMQLVGSDIEKFYTVFKGSGFSTP